MKRIVTWILTLIALVVGAFIIFASPVDPAAIIIGMFIISISILNIAVQIYFPPLPSQEVELKVVEEPKEQEKVPVKIVEKSKKATKIKKKR